MKILLLTGRLAAPIVREAAKECASKYDVDIHIMPIDVAALATPRFIASYLRDKVKPGEYDFVMVSGAIKGSMKIVEEEIGVKVVKGPIHATDIPFILEVVEPQRLSPDKPADFIVEKERQRYIGELLSRLEISLRSKKHIVVGSLSVPIHPPPIRVLSEVTEAHLLDRSKLLELVEKRIVDGADMVSVGFEANISRPDKVREVIRLIKGEFDVPVVLDSIIPAEIIAGVEAGADMVMSLEAGNIPKVASRLRDIPAVVIPYDSDTGFSARLPEEKVSLLERNIARAEKHGITNIIADPILDPINIANRGGTFESLIAYHMFRKKNPSIPMLMGIGNVTELIDVDSPGINALLTMLAAEIGVSIVLVVEKSVKAWGSTRETAIASQMASLAWSKKSPPKDLGIDLLVLKDKRRIDTPLDISSVEVVEASGVPTEYPLDPLGSFTIRVNHSERVIEALYKGIKGKILIRGRSAREIRDEILRRKLISSLSHAFYLGIELGKAEEALRIGKNYVQEEKLFLEKNPLSARARWENDD